MRRAEAPDSSRAGRGAHAPSTGAGLSLIEVVIAGLLLTAAVVPLIDLIRSLTRETEMTRTRTLARVLAHSVLERYRLEPMAWLARAMPAGRGGNAGARLIEEDPLLALPDGPVRAMVRAHAMTRDARFTAIMGERAVGTLEAEVRWQEGGRLRRYRVRSLVTDTGRGWTGPASPAPAQAQ